VSQIVELHLREAGLDAGVDLPWKPLVQNLLRVLCELSSDAESRDTAALRERMAEYRRSFGEALHPQEARQVAAACVKTCEQYLRRVHEDRTARESELNEVIAILREAASRFVGDSSDFHAELLSSADRFKTITRLDDIRDMKRRLAVEVSSLEQVVETKKQRDEQAIAALSQRVELLQADLQKAEEQAARDPLTNIANRGGFDRAIGRMIAAARASHTPLTLAMIDVDRFKVINDTHGHQVGDRVLLCTADWLRSAIRHTDFGARYGGEEFAVILADAALHQAEERFQRVLHDIADRSYDYDADDERRSVRFTVSCGLAELTAHETAEALIGRADQALYEAKQKGRNRVVARKVSRLARILKRQ
jgi:diguanylate cyclase